MSLPQVPECSVTRRADGSYQITHRETGDTASADTAEQLDIQAAILRCASSYTRRAA